MTSYLSVIIPVFNESKRVRKTLEEVILFLSKKEYTYEVIVVNDGSVDDTLQIIRTFSEGLSFIKIINIETNYGKGNAVKVGMLGALGEHRLFMDADNSTPINELDVLLPHSDQGVDIVIGSRRVSKSEIVVQRTWFRNILSTVFASVVGIIIPLQVKDPQNGFKIFSKKSVELIFPKQTINRWAFDVEILLIARKLNLRIEEVPIHWRNSNLSKMNFRGMVGMFVDILKIKNNLMMGKYD